MEQIGDVYGVTRERIKQVQLKALRKFRYKYRVEMLKSKLNDTEEKGLEHVNSSCPVIWLKLSPSTICFMKRQNILSGKEMEKYILNNPNNIYTVEFQSIFERIKKLGLGE